MTERNEEQTPREEAAPQESIPQPEEVVGAPSSSLVLLEAFKKTSSMPLTKEETEILLAPIEDYEIDLHPTKGPYVPWPAYNRRLNNAFGLGGWSMVRMGQPDFDFERKSAAIHMALVVQQRVISDAVGEFRETGTMSPYDCLEAARKNCLKRCCSNFGMFFELQDRRWKGQWLADHAVRVTEKRSDGSTYSIWKRKEENQSIRATSSQSQQSTSATKEPQPHTQEGFVRKVEGPTATGGYLLTIETMDGSVRLLGNKSLNKYPDKTQLVDLPVSFTTKTVPQRGGGNMTVLDTLEVMGDAS